MRASASTNQGPEKCDLRRHSGVVDGAHVEVFPATEHQREAPPRLRPATIREARVNEHLTSSRERAPYKVNDNGWKVTFEGWWEGVEHH